MILVVFLEGQITICSSAPLLILGICWFIVLDIMDLLLIHLWSSIPLIKCISLGIGVTIAVIKQHAKDNLGWK